MSNKRIMLWLGIWLVLLVGGLLLDQPISQWFHRLGFHNDNPKAGPIIVKGTHWADAVKMIGSFWATATIAAALTLTGALAWRKAGTLLLCAASSVITDPLKWVAGRARSVDDAGLLTDAMNFAPFSIRDPANSFPSGNTMIAFATAACLARYYPRWRWLFYALATLVGVERVLEVAHHLSDVVAGAAIGVGLSHGCMWALARWAPAPRKRPQLAQPELEAVEEGAA